MTLAADAKVVPFDTMKEVTRLYRDRLWQRANIAQLKDELALEVDDADDFFGRRIRKREADIAEIDSQLSAKIGADWHDPIPDGLTPDDYFVLAQKFDEYGRVAALLDIDAISVGFHEQAVILNRAKVVASDRLRSAEEL